MIRYDMYIHTITNMNTYKEIHIELKYRIWTSSNISNASFVIFFVLSADNIDGFGVFLVVH